MLHVPRHPYNELAIADAVTKACAWSDGSADFVFGDGTVLSFCDQMATFVAVTSRGDVSHGGMAPVMSSRGRASSLSYGDRGAGRASSAAAASSSSTAVGGRDMMLTHLALSMYVAKVRSALQVYNYFSENPRVIAGLTPHDAEVEDSASRREDGHDVWRQSSPIDALVLNMNRDLLEFDGSTRSWTLWCALRRVSLTLHESGQTFSVRWPARVTERDGAMHIFVSPLDSRGNVTGSMATQRSCHFVWLQQTFPVAAPPASWCVMLEMALQLLRDVVNEGGEPTAGDGAGRRWAAGESFCTTTPRMAWPNPASGPPKDRPLVRFSKIEPDDAYAFVAASQMQNVAASARMKSPSAQVLWRYDSDPVGRAPRAVYWNLFSLVVASPDPATAPVSSPRGDAVASRVSCGTVLAMVDEDGSAIAASPNGRAYTVEHIFRPDFSRHYHQAADGSIALPATTQPPPPPTRRTPEIDGEWHGTPETSDVAFSPLWPCVVEPPLTTHGQRRYLQFVGASLIHLSQHALALKNRAAAERLPPSLSPLSAGTQSRHPATGNGLLAGLRGLHEAAAGYTGMQPPAAEESGIPSAAGVPESTPACSSAQGPTVPGTSCSVPERHAAPHFQVAVGTQSAIRGLTATRLSMDAASTNPYVNAMRGVVRLTSRLDGVGTFTALTNGVCRAHFDDRTILTLSPALPDGERWLTQSDTAPNADATMDPSAQSQRGEHGLDLYCGEDSLVAHCLFRDATETTMRVVKCPPHHAMYRYLAYLIPFRRFANLPPEERATLPGVLEAQTTSVEDCARMRYTKEEIVAQQQRMRADALLRSNVELSNVNQRLLGPLLDS